MPMFIQKLVYKVNILIVIVILRPKLGPRRGLKLNIEISRKKVLKFSRTTAPEMQSCGKLQVMPARPA